jgi:hypothetical protein
VPACRILPSRPGSGSIPAGAHFAAGYYNAADVARSRGRHRVRNVVHQSRAQEEVTIIILHKLLLVSIYQPFNKSLRNNTTSMKMPDADNFLLIKCKDRGKKYSKKILHPGQASITKKKTKEIRSAHEDGV